MLLPIPAKSHQRRTRVKPAAPNTPPPPAALVLVAATYDVGIPSVTLTFDRAINIGAFNGTSLVVRKIFQIIRDINAQGVTIFLVEQNAHMALAVANRAYVLQTGEVIKSGPAKAMLEDPDVKKAYLGG